MRQLSFSHAAIPLIFTLALTALGCASSGGSQALSPVYQPTFEFEPAEVSEVAEAGVTVALLAPQWPDDIPGAWADVAGTFAENMSQDFQEMLTARGFTVKGPYRVYDEMVYADKAQSDLLLTPVLRVTSAVDDLDLEKNTTLNLLGPSKETFQIRSGSVTLGGNVTLLVSEPFTQERLWVQSIEIPKEKKTFQGEIEYDMPPDHPMAEPQFQSAVNRSLEGVYSVVMKEYWNRLVPEQLAVLRGQAHEIREKAGYTVGSR